MLHSNNVYMSHNQHTPLKCPNLIVIRHQGYFTVKTLHPNWDVQQKTLLVHRQRNIKLNQGNAALTTRGLAYTAQIISRFGLPIRKDVIATHFLQFSLAQWFFCRTWRNISLEDTITSQLLELLVMYLLCRLDNRFFREEDTCLTSSRL